jgi:hypothetical protein
MIATEIMQPVSPPATVIPCFGLAPLRHVDTQKSKA